MTKSLERSIKSRYMDHLIATDITPVSPMHPPKFSAGVLAVHEMSSGMVATLSDITEDATPPGDPSDPTTSKKSLAIMIAGALNRVVDGSNPVNTNYLLAALALLQLSTGDDQLMTVARRLATKGMNPSKKKIKEETTTIHELSKGALNKYLDDNYADRKAMVGDKFDRPKIGKKFDKRMAGAILAGQKLKRAVTESTEVNYKHKAIDDAHAKWNSDIDHTIKTSAEMGEKHPAGHFDKYRGTKEQIAKVKEFVDKHPHNRVPNALKMADHSGISDGLAAHFHKALKAVTESGMAKEKPFTQSDRIGRYLSDQRGRPRR